MILTNRWSMLTSYSKWLVKILTNRYSMLTSYSKWLVKMELGKHDCTFIQMTLSGYIPPSMTLTQVYLAIVNVQELLHGYKKSLTATTKVIRIQEFLA